MCLEAKTYGLLPPTPQYEASGCCGQLAVPLCELVGTGLEIFGSLVHSQELEKHNDQVLGCSQQTRTQSGYRPLWPTQAKACGGLSRKEGLWIRKIAYPGQRGGGSEEGTDAPKDQGPAPPAQPRALVRGTLSAFCGLKTCLTGWGLHKS